MSLAGVLSLVQALGLLLGFLLAVNAGRGLARRMHDAELARRAGRRLPGGLGVVFYGSLVLAFLLNLAVLAFTQAVSLGAKTLVGVVTGHLSSPLLSLVITLAGLVTGYAWFASRYRGVEKPLTREGRLVLRGVKLGGSALEKARRARERLPRGLPGGAPRPPGLGDALRRLGLEEENKENEGSKEDRR